VLPGPRESNIESLTRIRLSVELLLTQFTGFPAVRPFKLLSNNAACLLVNGAAVLSTSDAVHAIALMLIRAENNIKTGFIVVPYMPRFHSIAFDEPPFQLRFRKRLANLPRARKDH
jgi:hypothetical protein